MLLHNIISTAMLARKCCVINRQGQRFSALTFNITNALTRPNSYEFNERQLSTSCHRDTNREGLCKSRMTIVALNCQRNVSFWGTSKATDWNKAVMEAEKIVGYSTSFLSLRCLLSDELSNVAMHMRKLVGTSHPLLKTARKLFYDGNQSLQTRGLLVLLTSKAAGPAPDSVKINEVMISGIYPRQRTLAEITEMIHTAGLIHKGVINLSGFGRQTSAYDTPVTAGTTLGDMEFGNKMAILSGDFLLANASTGLASLRNTRVVEMISDAIGDIMKAEFTQLRDIDGMSVLPTSCVTVDNWEKQTFLSTGSLIAHSCAAALSLAGHPTQLQESAFQFGKQISFAHQINEELQPIITNSTRDDEDSHKVLTTSLPVILYTQSQPINTEADTKTTTSTMESDRNFLKLLKMSSSSAVDEAKHLRNIYGHKALAALENFKKSTARNALENIVKAIIRV